MFQTCVFLYLSIHIYIYIYIIFIHILYTLYPYMYKMYMSCRWLATPNFGGLVFGAMIYQDEWEWLAIDPFQVV